MFDLLSEVKRSKALSSEPKVKMIQVEGINFIEHLSFDNFNESTRLINSDQGSQFTCEDWIEHMTTERIQISMDGKGRAIDNIFIERFWRTLKYDYVYLNPVNDGLELYQRLKDYIKYYNHELHHQGIDRRIPAELYKPAA